MLYPSCSGFPWFSHDLVLLSTLVCIEPGCQSLAHCFPRSGVLPGWGWDSDGVPRLP